MWFLPAFDVQLMKDAYLLKHVVIDCYVRKLPAELLRNHA